MFVQSVLVNFVRPPHVAQRNAWCGHEKSRVVSVVSAVSVYCIVSVMCVMSLVSGVSVMSVMSLVSGVSVMTVMSLINAGVTSVSRVLCVSRVS